MNHNEQNVTLPELSKEEVEVFGRQMEQSCRESMAECEAKWRPEGKAFAWFSKEPNWAEGSLSWFWLKEPTEPCDRIFRFTMIGGGQVRTTKKWKWHTWIGGRAEDIPPAFTWRDDDTFLADTDPMRIAVTPHTGQSIHRYHHGIVVNTLNECGASAVVFGRHVPQDIVDRTAATLRLASIPDQESFYAMLDGSEGCAICGRPLRDEVSKLVGVGPDCARAFGIPHSIAAAGKRLKLREQLLRVGEAT